MGLVYLPTWNMFENFIKAIRTFLKDFERLASEQRQLFDSYVKNATPRNPDLYLSRAKHIEECLLLGVTAEFLLKAVLLKHSYVLNLEIAQRQKRFDPDFFKRIMDFNSKDPMNNKEYKSIQDEAERVMGKASGKTVDFKNCILIFMKDIVDANYFSRISKEKYDVANKETQEIYGKTIDTSDALWKIKLLRDNYAHIPDPMYEERGLLPYLYDFLVYIAKKEFPKDFT